MADQTALKSVKFRAVLFSSILGILLVAVLVNVILLGLLGYMLTHRQLPPYRAITSDGGVIELISLRQPLVTSKELLRRATLAATSINTYNFVNYRKVLEDLSEYFTPSGWREFQSALKSSGKLDRVISQKLTVTAVVTGAPIILDRGPINGIYKWKVQLPLLVTYESASTKESYPVVVTMLVTRVSTLETPRGIAIDAFSEGEQSASAGGAPTGLTQ